MKIVLKRNQALDAYNRSRYKHGKALQCGQCGKYVTIDDSYSNRGTNVICSHCARTLAEEHDLSLSEFLRKAEVWI